MEVAELLLGWIADVAWPLALLAIAIMYRRPIYALLGNVGDIAGRAAKEPTELELGGLKVVFKETIQQEQPSLDEETVDAVTETAFSFYTLTTLSKQARDALRVIVSRQGSSHKYRARQTALPRTPFDAGVNELIKNNILARDEKGRYFLPDGGQSVRQAINTMLDALEGRPL